MTLVKAVALKVHKLELFKEKKYGRYCQKKNNTDKCKCPLQEHLRKQTTLIHDKSKKNGPKTNRPSDFTSKEG